MSRALALLVALGILWLIALGLCVGVIAWANRRARAARRI